VDTGYVTSSGESGSVDGPHSKTAVADSKETVANSPGKTEIETHGAAAYPFIMSPNIDYVTRWTLIRGPAGATAVGVVGLHDSFPFYEILVNGKSLYSYRSKDNGPSITNLNTLTAFGKVMTV
jgi:hypothetical protein